MRRGPPSGASAERRGGYARAVLAALALAAASITAASAAEAQPQGVDYMRDAFVFKRVLGWGTRAMWSPDGERLAFTESDTLDSQAYELDLRSGSLRCLTCFLGANGRLSRLYYLPGGDFLVLAPEAFGRGNSPHAVSPGADARGTRLFWMSAAPGSPPQDLGAVSFGDTAIGRHADGHGEVRVAWGEMRAGKMLLNLGVLAVEGGKARLDDRRVVYDSTQPRGTAGATLAEAYSFVDGDRSVVFATLVVKNGVLDEEMYKVDIATGALADISRDPHQNETHAFPDDRYGLEESNRASDPNGRLRGVSGIRGDYVRSFAKRNGLRVPTERELATYAPFGALRGMGRPNDLYVTRMDGTGKPRRLTRFSQLGGDAHQSSASFDGRRIAFSLDARDVGSLLPVEGLYVGEFQPVEK